jgi:hypothetical protein
MVSEHAEAAGFLLAFPSSHQHVWHISFSKPSSLRPGLVHLGAEQFLVLALAGKRLDDTATWAGFGSLHTAIEKCPRKGIMAQTFGVVLL